MNFWNLLRLAVALLVVAVALLAAWLAPTEAPGPPLRPGIEIRP